MKKFPKGIYSYVLMMGHLCADISGGALPAILPFLITEKGITYAAAAGLTFALSSIGSVIQPVFGSMADKTSRPWLMALGIFMSGCGISMLGFIYLIAGASGPAYLNSRLLRDVFYKINGAPIRPKDEDGEE